MQVVKETIILTFTYYVNLCTFIIDCTNIRVLNNTNFTKFKPVILICQLYHTLLLLLLIYLPKNYNSKKKKEKRVNHNLLLFVKFIIDFFLYRKNSLLFSIFYRCCYINF